MLLPCGDIQCLCVPYTESRDVSTTANTHTHMPEEQSPLPVFTHSEDWGINSMMKPNTTTAALSADGLGNSPGKRTQTHTHTCTPFHSSLATTCTDKQIIMLRVQRRWTNCFSVHRKTIKQLREATSYNTKQHESFSKYFGTWILTRLHFSLFTFLYYTGNQQGKEN